VSPPNDSDRALGEPDCRTTRCGGLEHEEGTDSVSPGVKVVAPTSGQVQQARAEPDARIPEHGLDGGADDCSPASEKENIKPAGPSASIAR